MNKECAAGYIVHAYPDNRRNRLYLVGKLTDGRSFAAVEERWRPYFHVKKEDLEHIRRIFSIYKYDVNMADVESFSGRDTLMQLCFYSYNERFGAAAALKQSGIKSPDACVKPVDLYLTEKQIYGAANITGFIQSGKKVDVIFRSPQISPAESGIVIPLRVASIDIETDTNTGCIRAVSTVWTDSLSAANNWNDSQGIVRVLAPSGYGQPDSNSPVFHSDEPSLLKAFLEDIRVISPDILTGWNFIDFDFPKLAERFKKFNIPFTLGRSSEYAKFLPGDEDTGLYRRRRSASAIVPGRQVIDALRVTRFRIESRQGFSLEEVAQQILGEGKAVNEKGDDKIAALDKLYQEDPVQFGEYCLRDARLVLGILAKTGLFRLTLERASLTGVALDKAWTNVVSFERVYGMELKRAGIAMPCDDAVNVTGAAGGTVLEPDPGLFNNVAVFDFRSLYPTIIRTFNIDPLSHARAWKNDKEHIAAPNGAVFSREPGLLPALIAKYFAKRRSALDSGDAIAAQVYKILMNSFYGVLGTKACRYGRTELAGAITSFARKWLLFSRDWFNSQGFRVLYGDTDSLFVETGFGDTAELAVFKTRCTELADKLNIVLTDAIKAEYGLDSFIELRFEKAYRRFMIPPLRHIEENQKNRGRAKGYGGHLLNDNGLYVEVKGMEAVRSDTTPLARRLQVELLELVFSGSGENKFREKVTETIRELQKGSLDDELVYRKRLVRYPETYTSNTPPQVKAARALGWKNRRGTIEYLWTTKGPQPIALPHAPVDYDHYIVSQIFPLAKSIAAATNWDTCCFTAGRNDAYNDWQMELF